MLNLMPTTPLEKNYLINPAVKSLSVKIDRWNRDYLAITFTPNEFILAAIREIPGREWIHSQKHWRIPVGSTALLLTLLDSRKIIYEFTEMGIKYIQAYRDMRQNLINIKLRKDSKEVLIDGMEYPLRPYQADGVDFITLGRRVLLADDMGLGKTVEAIASILLFMIGNISIMSVFHSNVVRI